MAGELALCDAELAQLATNLHGSQQSDDRPQLHGQLSVGRIGEKHFVADAAAVDLQTRDMELMQLAIVLHFRVIRSRGRFNSDVPALGAATWIGFGNSARDGLLTHHADSQS